MVTSLFKHERIRTTDAKAKELRRWADHLITLAKRGDLHARRQALSIVREKDVVHKLFENATDRFGGTSGGYTRIIKLGRRLGDAASISLIELVSPEIGQKKKKADKPRVETSALDTQAVASQAKPDEKVEGEAKEAPEAETTEAVTIEEQKADTLEETVEPKETESVEKASEEKAEGKKEEK